MIDVTINDDYAVLTTTNYGFYYGYEYDKKECECGETEEIWGFEVNGNNGKLFGISFDDMKNIKGCPDKWDCNEMLLFGIGLFINKLPDYDNFVQKIETQQKEFIKYLEDEISKWHNNYDSYNYEYEVEEPTAEELANKILQKYKEIIGDKDGMDY